MKKRIKWVDVAKGILISLVVLGHSDIHKMTGILINSFDMAAFFSLSGITFHCSENYKKYTIKKLKNLLVPYLYFSIIMLFYFAVKAIVWKRGDFSIKCGILSFFIPISGRNSTSVYGLWFLPCLFLAEMLLYIILKTKEKNIYLASLFFVLICVGCFIINKITNVTSVLSILPIALIFLLVGIEIRKNYNQIEKNKRMICISSFITFLLVVIINYIVTESMIDLSSMTLGSWPLYIVSGLAGTIFICSFAMIIQNVGVFSVIGRDSVYYYGLHYEIISVVEKILRWGVLQTIITIAILYPVINIWKYKKVGRINDKCNCTSV